MTPLIQVSLPISSTPPVICCASCRCVSRQRAAPMTARVQTSTGTGRRGQGPNNWCCREEGKEYKNVARPRHKIRCLYVQLSFHQNQKTLCLAILAADVFLLSLRTYQSQVWARSEPGQGRSRCETEVHFPVSWRDIVSCAVQVKVSELKLPEWHIAVV